MYNRDSRSRKMEWIKIPALEPALSSDMTEDRSLCPVRALEVYKERTKLIRLYKKSRKLFISYQKNRVGDVHKNTFTSWIKQLILHAHKNSPESIIALSSTRVHEVRAMAASVGWKANMSLAHILKAGTRRKHTTFTGHYLKDVSLIQNDLHSLGPLAVSQQVVQVPAAH